MAVFSIVARLIFTVMLVVSIAGCTNNTTCIRGDGRWSNDLYSLGSKEIKRDEPIDFFVTIDCWGRYHLWPVIAPKPRYILGQGIREDGRNNFYEEVLGEDGSIEKKLLVPYKLRYIMEVSSLDKPDKTWMARKEWVQPPSPYSQMEAPFVVPRDFSLGEKLRIRFTIFAEDGFYDDYGTFAFGLKRNMVID